jgi:hypothetical protein
VVAASAAILWLQPARSWFDGTTAPERRTTPAPLLPTTQDPAPARPPAVLWACVLTWICTGLVTLALVVSLVTLALSPDLMLDEVHRENPDLAAQGISDSVLMLATYLMIVGLVFWCAGAAGLAVLVFRRVDWARIVLILSAAACSALCLLGTAVGVYVLVVPLLVSASCIAMLMRADTRPWFDRRALSR